MGAARRSACYRIPFKPTKPFKRSLSKPFKRSLSKPFKRSLSKPFTLSLSKPFTLNLSKPFTLSLSKPFTLSLSKRVAGLRQAQTERFLWVEGQSLPSDGCGAAQRGVAARQHRAHTRTTEPQRDPTKNRAGARFL